MGPRFHGIAALCLLALLGPAARAQLQCQPALVDFGRRPQNQVATAQVRLTNTTLHRVDILSVQSDCGCTTAEIPVLKLAPGESTTMTVHMQSGGHDGEVHHEVTVALAGGASVFLPVKMVVYVYANWTVVPSRLILSPSRRGTESVSELRVARVGADRLGILPATSGSPDIEITPSSSAGNIIVYQVKKLSRAPAGAIYTDIKIETGDPASPVLDVPVFAYVTSGVTVEPSPIIMPTVKAGQTAVMVVRITGWEGTRLPRSELSGGRVRFRGRQNGEIILELALASLQPGSSTHSLALYDGKELVTEVPVFER